MMGLQATSFWRRMSPTVLRMVGVCPYRMVSQPTVSRRETHAVAERRGESIITVYPMRLRAKKVTTIFRSERVRRATISPSFLGCTGQSVKLLS
jgi:hypothetical protein